jgi:hypothetical protein
MVFGEKLYRDNELGCITKLKLRFPATLRTNGNIKLPLAAVAILG